MKLELACGQRLNEGYTGVDLFSLDKMFPNGAPQHYDGRFVQADLLSFPWPFKDSSVAEVTSEHFVEHIPHERPEWGRVDGWWMFFQELWRVMEPGGIATMAHPHSRSDRAFWDQTHTRYIHMFSWLYLQRAWREDQKLSHYTSPDLDFEIVSWEPTGVYPDYQGMDDIHDVQYAKAIDQLFNVWSDLIVTLKVVK